MLSLDIDGNDYHVLEAIENLNARVVLVEYNPKYRPPVKWVMQYNPRHSYDGSDYFGSSLKSYEELLLEIKREMILNEASLKEISYDFNFNNPANFSKFIKSNTGKSASELKAELLTLYNL